MGWIDDLLKESPSAARYKAELEAMQKENAALKLQVSDLRQEIQRSDDVIQKAKSHGQLVSGQVVSGQGGQSVSAQGTVTDPKDFSEGGGDHRKSVLASTALIVVLLASSSPKLEPMVFGVLVPERMLWFFLASAHVYFFVMWRLTTNIEADKEKRFWNPRGLWKLAKADGTSGFPGKMKAQLLLIRALPIWAFVIGCLGVSYGLCKSFGAV